MRAENPLLTKVGGGSCFEEPFVSFQTGGFLKKFYRPIFYKQSNLLKNEFAADRYIGGGSTLTGT